MRKTFRTPDMLGAKYFYRTDSMTSITGFFQCIVATTMTKSALHLHFTQSINPTSIIAIGTLSIRNLRILLGRYFSIIELLRHLYQSTLQLTELQQEAHFEPIPKYPPIGLPSLPPRPSECRQWSAWCNRDSHPIVMQLAD